MSTLKTSNIQDTSGNNNSTPEEIGKGRAKAWVNYDGSSGTAGQDDTTIRSSYNVSSVTNNSTGVYTVNFTNDMPNANYVALTTGGNNGGTGEGGWVATNDNTTNTVSSVQVATYTSGGNHDDTEQVYVVVFAD